MAGLINTGKKIDDPILKQVERGIDAKVPPQLRKNYNAILVSAMKIIYSSDASERIANKLRESQDPKSDVSQGTANIIAMVYNEVTPNMSDKQKTEIINAAMPAGISLMCQLLDFADKIGNVQITKDFVAEVAHATSKELLAKFGMDENMVNEAVKKGQQSQGV